MKDVGAVRPGAAAGKDRPEIELKGGTANRGLVVRVGDTVRRPRSAASSGIHALLVHLERVRFAGAPSYLGVDDQGREILSFLDGEVPIVPHPPWAFTDDTLVSVADLLRRYHEAVRTFDPSPYTWSSSVPGRFRTGLLSHNDPNLDNIVFRGSVAVALIDFDLASPGSALWDLALAARLWVPLRDPSEVPGDLAERTGERLRLIADAYGLPPSDRRLLAGAIRATHTWCYDIVRQEARLGRRGYADYWTATAQEHDARGQRWLDANENALTAALGN